MKQSQLTVLWHWVQLQRLKLDVEVVSVQVIEAALTKVVDKLKNSHGCTVGETVLRPIYRFLSKATLLVFSPRTVRVIEAGMVPRCLVIFGIGYPKASKWKNSFGHRQRDCQVKT